jgi:hypothetical protein
VAWSDANVLFKYRRGELDDARKERFLADNPPRLATFTLIQAMATWRLRDQWGAMIVWTRAYALIQAGARHEMVPLKVRSEIFPGLSEPDYLQAPWYDWAVADLLLREWDEMVGEAERSVSSTRGRTLSLEEIAIVRAAGEYHALRGDWSDALRCSRDCVQSNQQDSVDHATMDYLNAAIACLELGDEETYLRLREEMAARFKDASDVASLRTLEVGLLRRFDVHAGAGLEPFVRVLTRRVQEGKDQNDYWDRILLSLHEYRIGNFANSMDFARQSLTRLQEGGRVPDAAVSVLLAMSLSRSGNRSAASSELNRAESVLQTGFDLDYDMWNWRRWVLVRLLLREARGLISQSPPGPPGAAPR